MPLKNGTRLGLYEIVSELGAGGMGEVWRARDARLDREVAIKVLPAGFAKDAGRLRRFAQEARAVSALNHPNIITIHEVGEAAGAHFIVTELVAGRTLRRQLSEARLSLMAALDVTLQIASALAAAHEAGIIHRDIKPENVMIRPDGLVKVLDFGLAKLTEKRQPPAHDSAAPTALKANTDPGTVMGTAQYMSPEQARGLEVDSRTDVFSLGAMLYEMIAGRAPFEGKTTMDVMAAILDREPAPISQHMPNSAEATPAELQRIVSKALRKDREERYQTSKDLLLDLKSLKQEIEIEARLKGRAAIEAGAQTADSRADKTAEVELPRTISSAEVILSEIKRHKRGVGNSDVVLLSGFR